VDIPFGETLGFVHDVAGDVGSWRGDGMRRRHELTDQPWAKTEPLLPGKPGDPGRSGEDQRLFVNAVAWIAKTGSPRRDLPEHFGRWNAVFRRFFPLAEGGRMESDRDGVEGQARTGGGSARYVDPSRSPARGWRKRGRDKQAIGRSRGGLTTIIPVAVAGSSRPPRLRSSGGESHEVTEAQALIKDLSPQIRDHGPRVRRR
jgi:transposase